MKCIKRIKKNKHDFAYTYSSGKTITSKDRLRSIRKIRVPKSYSDVCINEDTNSKLQATGKDSKGRIQYIYSTGHHNRAKLLKCKRLKRFGILLPSVRKHIQHLLSGGSITSRRRGLALTLMDRCYLRPGSPDYVRRYNTHGASTLQRGHISRSDGDMLIKFKGKRGITNKCRIPVNIDLYESYEGLLRDKIGLSNPRYLNKEIPTGIFLKDMRTWGANVEFVKAYLLTPNATLKDLITIVAKKIQNTPSVCRKSYVVPILQRKRNLIRTKVRQIKGLSLNESILLNFLFTHECESR